MNKRFEKHVDGRSDLFIPFIVAGDPTEEATIKLALMLQEEGANAIELGIPYSDPLADGPVIQRASIRALEHGMSLEKAMNIVPKMRERGLEIPVIVFTYYNLLLQLGEERFFALVRENNIDGLLVPDLPFEESEEWRESCKMNDTALISLVAPTTSDKRLTAIAKEATGFLYCVSSLGVTGTRTDFHSSVFEFIDRVKSLSPIPVAVGFGVSAPEQVAKLKEYCDGVIVGSAIVRQIEAQVDGLTNEETQVEAIDHIRSYIRDLISPYEKLKINT
ncbi:tryptophan synthase subunit alpha [Pseudalkalibacillus hwajinpoensis]|uniref:Tryptophan synthase alpha chain n=1 Tax=Guptibacillus hwajinpoensis TaxID=208199 RepID=A0A4U1MHN9_9BACL|nr:tryptophan synthase subunit alpha [Pseudalkalibacillus hwajinpoensis]TKD69840.1 tryptophan synthase subunit alpha [Pseudalkalibacillus hwajinpoensis]